MILLDPQAHPIVGHRGAAGRFPENTLLAFQRALAAGADALELDVRISADGVPVVIHDATLDRTTDGSGLVRDRRAAELETLDAGRGERIPRLVNVLESYPAAPLIIEIKEEPVACPVAELLRWTGSTRRVLVGAFQRSALRAFAGPEFARAAARAETALFWAGSRMGAAVTGGGYRAFTVPERHRGLRVVDARFVRSATRRGFPVHVWTVNDVADARRLRAMGVAGIITDFPERMREELQA